MANPSDFVPSIFQQIFANGDSCSGVAYEGTAEVLRTSAAFPARDGRVYRNGKAIGDGAIDGGLIPVGALRPKAYNRLDDLYVKLPGCTAVAAYAVDEDGVAYLLASSATDTLVVTSPYIYDLLPGWSVKVVGTGGITGPGAINASFSDWGFPIPHLF